MRKTLLVASALIAPLSGSCSKESDDDSLRGSLIAVGGTELATNVDFRIQGDAVVDDNEACGGTCNPCPSPTPARLSEVHVDCPGARCAAGLVSKSRFQIGIAAERPGPVDVSIELHDTEGRRGAAGKRFVFIEPARIGILRKYDLSPEGRNWAALPGSTRTWCARVEDARGSPLWTGDDAVSFWNDGPAKEIKYADGCKTFHFESVGHVSVHAKFQRLARTEGIDVFAPDESTKVEIAVVEGAFGVIPIEFDPMRHAAASSEMAIPEDACDAHLALVLRATFPSGALALGVIDREAGGAFPLSVRPSDLAFVSGDGAVGTLEPGRRGAGTLVGRIGASSVALPLLVDSDCHRQLDAGVDIDGADAAGGDAHDDDSGQPARPDGGAPTP